MNTHLFRLCLLVVACLLMSGTNIGHASPTHERDYEYFTGCGTNLTDVGGETYTCDGLHFTSGVLSGHWVLYTEFTCDDFNLSDQQAWEICNGVWKSVSVADLQAGNCSCP
jgi:hypothetical protein